MPCPIVPAPSTVIDLTATELRLPFLEIGLQALLGIVALEQTLLQLALERETLGETGFESGLHGSLDVANGFGGLVRRRELPGVFLNRVTEAAAVQIGIAPHVIDDTKIARLFEREQCSCRQHFDRL